MNHPRDRDPTAALDIAHVLDLAKGAARDLASALDLDLDLDLADALADALVRDIDRASALTRASASASARDLDRALTRASDIARDRASASALDHARGIARGIALDIARDLALDIARDLDRDLDPASVENQAHDLVRDLAEVNGGSGTRVRGERGRQARTAKALSGAAAALLPRADRARYAEEYRAELTDLAAAGAGRWRQLGYALRLLTRAGGLRLALRAAGRRREAT